MRRLRRLMSRVLMAAGMVCLLAQAAPAVETSANMTYVSKYIWRGWDLAPTNEPALQGGVSVSWGSGMSFDAWGSYALDGDPQLDELDYTLGYSTMISRLAEFSAGYTHYTFPSITSAAESQTESSEIFLGVGFPDVFLAPSLTVYEDYEDGDGTYYFLGAGHDFALGEEEFPLSLSLGVGYNSGQWGNVSGISDIDIGLSTTFESGTVGITPSINYVITPEDAVNADNEFWVGVGFDFAL